MTRPQVLVAPDKFKGSLTAAEAAAAMAAGAREAMPDAVVTSRPIADGGEGSVDALVAAGAELRTAVVTDPFGGSTEAHWAVMGERAVIELAQASGLRFRPSPRPEDALAAGTRGVGQLLRRALDDGYRDILIAIGGSASTDGGFGAATELGLRVLDASGREIPAVRGLVDCVSIDATGVDPRLAESRIVIATDVSSPLTGPTGAACMFGPQKGADAVAVALLERRLGAWGRVLDMHTKAVTAMPGVGAAGGFAAPFLALGIAQLASGADEVAAILGIAQAVSESDIVLIGEGSLDEQSLMGKEPIAVARLGVAAGARVIAVCGRSLLTADQLSQAGIAALESIVDIAPTAEAAFTDAPALLRRATGMALRASP
ncbi:glycerate kinase [Agrococcus baldri]|uniref:glycerate kinase n=1 Tax=Agrococcus baldri TaxID=153730 RepID=UPI00296EF709|nr:glycerate kinase [Agrococcus baldri]